MKRTRKIRLVASMIALTMAGAAMSACSSQGQGGGGDDGVLRLSLANHPWTDYMKTRIGEFEEEHGIKVEFTAQTADQLSAAYNVKLNAGSTDLDVLMYRPTQEGLQFARNGWLQRLDDKLSDDAEYAWEDFSDSAIDTVAFEGAVYGVPTVTEREVLFYRTDLFEQAGVEVPTTFDELRDVAEVLHDPDAGLYAYAARGQKAPAVTQLSGFFYSHGADFMVDGKAAINTPEAIAAYEEYGSLIREFGPVGSENMSTEQIIPLFQQGGIAMWIDAEPFWSTLVDESSSTVAENVGVAPLPAGPAGSHPYSVASWGLALNPNSTQSDLALDFVKWATSPEMVADVQRSGVFGARDSVWADDSTLSGIPKDFADTLRLSVENGVGHDRPVVVQVARARDIVGGPMITAIQGGDVEAAANKAQAEFETFLENDATATTTK